MTNTITYKVLNVIIENPKLGSYQYYTVYGGDNYMNHLCVSLFQDTWLGGTLRLYGLTSKNVKITTLHTYDDLEEARTRKSLLQDNKKHKNRYHNEKINPKITCECGSEIKKLYLNEHLKTKKHQRFTRQD